MGLLSKLGLIEKEPELKDVPIKAEKTLNQPTLVVDLNTSNEFTSDIDAAIEKRNLSGPDFLEFWKTLKSIDNQPLTLQQKYQMAFSGLSTMGLTKEKIIETSDVYLSAIKDEKIQFDKDMTNINQNMVVNKNLEAQRLTDENTELQNKIQQNIKLIGELNISSNEALQKINTKTQNFNIEITNKENTISNIINNVKSFL